MPTRSRLSPSRWSTHAARRWSATVAPPELGLRIYGSRLLGADPALVLAGGGNTSVKVTLEDLHGEAVAALFVKGSGADLATVTAQDFAPLELAPLRRLLELPRLADRDLLRELLRARLDPAAPAPSVETLLHALLPHRFVDHAHPDAALALVATRDGARRAEELWGEDCLIVPYVKPGFDLARRCATLWRRAAAAGARPRGIVLLHHGLVAFSDDARESYETLLELAARAARKLPRHRVPPRARERRPPPLATEEIARLRRALSRAAGRPLLLALRDERELLAYLDRPDLGRISQRGPLTPDHVLRTRRLPLLLGGGEIEVAVERYAAARQAEFERRRGERPLAALDPAPRVVLAPGTGLFGAGPSAAEARLASEIAARTAWAIQRAEALGGYRPLSPAALFEFEHWGPERAKLERGTAPRPLAGRIALVTGSSSGIGRAAAEALLAQGAAVVGVDLEPSTLAGEFSGVVGDASSPRLLRRAVELAARRYGGLDIVVSNLGIFFAGPRIAALADADWRRTMRLNVDAHLALLREAIPLLRHAPAGGAVVVVGSKNVRAPGPGAAAYSASKAALTQLARVAALELAADGVRVNVVHPDAVFDTAVWTPERIAERARNYGLSVAQYRRRNLLHREVTAAAVGAVIAALAGDLFALTTGAQIPIDGGNERVV
jgi:rhamnose utilization protein RhaD (predicted bifunctional aldolase and dehydrogenase)/NAD(P)-dependent dehydrogenase (short-subunit alcohol dehydrogenase family)